MSGNEYGTEPKLPAIPDVRTGGQDAILAAIKEITEVRLGVRGDPLDRAITARDLLNAGLASAVTGGGGVNLQPPVLDAAPVDSATPPTVENLAAAGAFQYIILSWEFPPEYSRLAYFEVWRAATDALGDATKIVQTNASVYADDVSPGASFYYWLRAVSDAGVEGAYNAVGGTLGSTAADPNETMKALLRQLGYGEVDVANGVFPFTTVGALPALPHAKYPPGVCVLLTADGKLYRNVNDAWTAAVAATDMTGQIVGTQITDGAISTDKLAANSVIAGKIGAGAIVAGDGVIANAAIDSAHIVDAAITTAKIADLAVDNAKIADLAVNNAKIASLDAAKVNTGYLSAERISAGSITASHIDSRGLSIKDNAGEVILAAGSALNPAYAAPGTRNSEAIFSPKHVWEFRNTLDGWDSEGGSATVTANADSITLTPIVADARIKSPVISVNGALYDKVRMRVRRTGGTGWDMTVLYATAGHGFSGSYLKSIASDPTILNQWVIIEWDMAALTQGGADWTSNTITQLRIDLGGSMADTFEIDWIVVGKYGPVTIGELGYSGDLNATYGARAGVNLTDSAGAIVTDDFFKNNLIDVSWWKRGAAIPWTQNYEFNAMYACSPAGTLDISWALPGPKGGSDVVWYAKETTGDGSNSGGWIGAPITLNPNRAYRFVVPIYKMSGPNTWAYWGTVNVCDLNTTTTVADNNPYFAAANIPVGKWFLFVGYIFPAGSVGNSHDGAGIFDCTTGEKIANTGTNFNFQPGNGNVNHRATQFYATTGDQMLFGRPMINVVDGTEPSLLEYFPNAGVLNTANSYGGNLCFNGDFARGLEGWGVSTNPFSAQWDYCNDNHSGVLAGVDWAINGGAGEGATTLQVNQPNATTTGYMEILSNNIPVVGGKRYCVSAYTAAHRCNVDVFAHCYDANGTFISTWGANADMNTASASGGKLLSNYKRHQQCTTLPSNASSVRIALRKHATLSGNSDSWMFVGRVQLEEVGPLATKAGAWSPPNNSRAVSNALNDKLSKSASSILQAPITVSTSGGVVAGTLTWDASSGLRTGGNGTAITPYGMIAHNGTKYTFTLQASDGSATFAGTLDAASGTFGAITIAGGGYMRSSNYVLNSAGFTFNADGYAEIGVLAVRGSPTGPVSGSSNPVPTTAATLVTLASAASITAAHIVTLKISGGLDTSFSGASTVTVRLYQGDASGSETTLVKSWEASSEFTDTWEGRGVDFNEAFEFSAAANARKFFKVTATTSGATATTQANVTISTNVKSATA